LRRQNRDSRDLPHHMGVVISVTATRDALPDA
jgi:hypothetical protein